MTDVPEAGVERTCLVVDGDGTTAEGLRAPFAAYGIRTVTAVDARAALDALRDLAVDAVVCSAHPAADDPLALMRTLLSAATTPVMLLTPSHDEVDQIVALELGASDVVALPASPRLLVARLRRLMRAGSRSPATGPREVRLGGLRMNPSLAAASLDGRPLQLTSQQFDTLLLLASNPGTLVNRETISRTVRGLPNADSRSVDVTVSRLRRKLRELGASSLQIGAQYGKGYYLTVRLGDAGPDDSGGQPERTGGERGERAPHEAATAH